MNGLLVALWMALQLEGTGVCPAASEVEQKLAPLLPPGFASESADRATIVEDAAGALSVSLARPDGTSIAERRLPRSANCTEQAETVAVMLAVWEAQIHPEIALRLDRLTTPSPAGAPPVSSADHEIVVRKSEAATSGSVRRAAIGAAVVGSWQPGSVAPGGRIDATLEAAGWPLRWRLSASALGRHRESLPPGEADWGRLYAAAGADYLIPLGRRWALSLGAAGVLGVASVEGNGFMADRTAESADLGIEGLLRVDLRLGALRPWLGLAVVAWLRQQTLEVTGTAGSSLVLPRIEPLIALGADFCWQP